MELVRGVHFTKGRFVAPEVDIKAQMIVIDKEDQILPAFQIMTREGRRM